MKRPFAKILILPALLCLFSAFAQNNAVLEFSQPEYKTRYYDLIDQLRCLVCQNQSIADSNADLAVDLRMRVYRMIEEGTSDEAIINFMVERYGDFVLYNPPFKKSTLLLWFAPFIVIGVGSVLLVIFIVRRDKDTISEKEISESMRRRVSELMQQKKKRDSAP